MVVASFLFACMGVCVKLAAVRFSAAEIVFYRSLINFLFMIPLTGILFEKTGKSFWKQFGAMVLGTLVCYLFGTVWLCPQLNLDFIGGLGVGVIPYLPGDTAKIILAALIGPVIVKALKRAE